MLPPSGSRGLAENCSFYVSAANVSMFHSSSSVQSINTIELMEKPCFLLSRVGWFLVNRASFPPQTTEKSLLLKLFEYSHRREERPAGSTCARARAARAGKAAKLQNCKMQKCKSQGGGLLQLGKNQIGAICPAGDVEQR